MNRIENAQIRFFFEHEARIREWAGLETEVIKFVDGFYRSLKEDLDEALASGRVADSGVESFLDGGGWPCLGLRRQDWPPRGDRGVDVRLEWNGKSACLPPHGHLICGVCTSVKEHRLPFTKGALPAFPLRDRWWAAYKRMDPPADRFWEDDNLAEYRQYLVETVFQAWEELAPLVDQALDDRSG